MMDVAEFVNQALFIWFQWFVVFQLLIAAMLRFTPPAPWPGKGNSKYETLLAEISSLNKN